MSAVAAAHMGLDTALLARLSGERSPLARATPVDRPQAHETIASVTPSASLRASLYARLDDAYAVAKAERSASGGDPSQGNPELLRKLYPPYPAEYKDRLAYLDRLAGLGRQNDALMLSAERAVARPEVSERIIQELSQSAAHALSDRPNQGLTRNPANFAQQFGEEHA